MCTENNHLLTGEQSLQVLWRHRAAVVDSDCHKVELLRFVVKQVWVCLEIQHINLLAICGEQKCQAFNLQVKNVEFGTSERECGKWLNNRFLCACIPFADEASGLIVSLTWLTLLNTLFLMILQHLFCCICHFMWSWNRKLHKTTPSVSISISDKTNEPFNSIDFSVSIAVNDWRLESGKEKKKSNIFKCRIISMQTLSGGHCKSVLLCSAAVKVLAVFQFQICSPTSFPHFSQSVKTNLATRPPRT